MNNESSPGPSQPTDDQVGSFPLSDLGRQSATVINLPGKATMRTARRRLFAPLHAPHDFI